MAKEVFIQTSKEHRTGSSVNYSDCTVQFDVNCVAKVTEEEAQDLLEEDGSLKVLSEKEVAKLPKAKKVTEEPKEEAGEDELASLKAENKELKEALKTSDESLRAMNDKLIALKEEKENEKETLRRSKLSKEEKAGEDKMAKELQKLKVEELNEMAKKADLPQKEWEALDKDKFVWYLIKNS